jgi:hypothetical protein
MAFTFKLEHDDGTPADPPVLQLGAGATIRTSIGRGSTFGHLADYPLFVGLCAKDR